jgi:hypothetical protein
MSAATSARDRGLVAVGRVRGVREQDSRVGLQHAIAEERVLGARLAGYEHTLAASTVPEVLAPARLVALRSSFASLGELIGATRAEASTATALAADALARWSADKARLAAVEHLLEARAARRRALADRRTAAEADDLAAQRWQRLTRDQDRPEDIA